MLNINKKNFEVEVLKSKVPVIVDFWADWCGPCRMLTPIFEELGKEFTGRVKFAKINVEEEQLLASNSDIRGIPALVIFKNGKEIGRIIGCNTKKNLERKINEILGK